MRRASDGFVGLGKGDADGVRCEALWHGGARFSEGPEAQAIAGEAGTGVQPAMVVHEVSLARLEAESALAACDRPAEGG